MSGLLWKAVSPDGTSRGGLRWDVGTVVRHPTSTRMVRDEAETYLSLSVEPAETLIGRGWPCRLFRVEPIGDVIDSDWYRHKRCVLAARVVEEVEPWRALGPNGGRVAALIDRVSSLTADEVRRLAAAEVAARSAARDAAWDAARAAARDAARFARDAARDAVRDAARDAARVAVGSTADRAAAWAAAGDAAVALIVEDLISPEHFATLTFPWRQVIGLPEEGTR